MQNNKNGFTLIELLVVVLIIGILAGVALPQYKKAVNKARVAEYKTNLSTLYKAAQVYLLADPSFTIENLTDLDIEIPACKPFGSFTSCGYGLDYPGNKVVSYVIFDSTALQIMLTPDGFLCGGSEADTLCKQIGFNGGHPANNYNISGDGYTE